MAEELTVCQIQQCPLHPNQIISAAHPDINKLRAFNLSGETRYTLKEPPCCTGTFGFEEIMAMTK